ncbi:MAG: hypothetical protein QOH57_5216 [Mycobacterium sp.]|jgi:hypothetical protein|nr:hypothetical protein [Mycobacterium sp.]
MAPRSNEDSEQDVGSDSSVASSRAGEGDEDGSYVGRSGADDSFDAGESGAEARSTDG